MASTAPNPSTASDILERQPPFDLAAERGVLGSAILKPDVLDDVVMMLRSEDFYDDAHQALYREMCIMHDEGKMIDPTLLVSRLKANGQWESMGGAQFLANVSKSVANAAHVIYYAELVREKATYRSLIDAATEIVRDAYNQTDDARSLLSASEQKIFSIVDDRGSSSVAPLNEILHLAMDRMEARMAGEHADGSVDTLFHDFDQMTGGLHQSELIILAARPSMGKTALAMNMTENVAIQGNHPVLFVSLEMSSLELCDRLLCSAAQVNGHRLRNGTISNADRQRLVETASDMSQAPLYVDDSPTRTVSEIAAGARRILKKHGSLGLIVIDYLQLIEPDNPRDPRQEQVARIARRLKGLARDLEVPVLCLAQLNRQAEDSRDHRPRLSHLRESGAIEQDADVVMFIHREEYYHRGDEAEQFKGEAELIISKQRNGPVGTVELAWQKEYTRFSDKAPERLEAFDDYNEPAGF